MSLIICMECGKEYSDKASACPNCGCPTDENISDINSGYDSTDNSGYRYSETDTNMDNSKSFASAMQDLGNSAINNWNNRNRATSKISAVKIDEEHRKFQINGTIPKNGKKTSAIGKSLRGVMAVSTLGMSIATEKVLGLGGNSVGDNKWFDFDQLLSYELLEDDSIVTSGGVGQALVAGAVFGGFGAVAGGITGKRTQKKKIDSLTVKVTINDFNTPCIFIPIVSKPIKYNSREYQVAITEAQRILSALDVITHNK